MTEIESGFLIVRSYATLYQEFRVKSTRPFYGIPRVGIPRDAMPKRYRGIDREPLGAWSDDDLKIRGERVFSWALHERNACLAMVGLEARGASRNDFIFEESDAREVFAQLDCRDEWEIVWARKVTARASPPTGYRVCGYEPTWWTGDHFSALCDCMCFPRWHGTDADGSLFAAHFDRLNGNALFDTAEQAEDFLRFYVSLDWTETGRFEVAEVSRLDLRG